MVRAEGGAILEHFESQNVVALGWDQVPDLSDADTRDAVRALYRGVHPEKSAGSANNSIGMLYRFRAEVEPGDRVVTYDPEKRIYWIGELIGDYFYDPAIIPGYPHARQVKWIGRVSRDALRTESKNSLGSTLTVFKIREEVAGDLEAALAGRVAAVAAGEEEEEATAQVKEDYAAVAHEFTKDRLLALDDREMEHLVAAVLRAMGYRARVTPVGPDRGVDVIASPDGLGLEAPRIRAEVKHRSKTSIGSGEIRSFIAGLRGGDRGLYVSSGGFTKEAKYEAERSLNPVTLVNLDDLATLVVSHYESFDVDGRTLLPLVRIYMPA